jgi:phage shock protein PspC (stress-responsive transcriptional regulator)
MKELLRKLSSRKLWMAIAGVATGVAMALGADTTEIGSVAGAVTALISAVTYIIVEGKVDAEGVKNAIEATQDAVDIIEGTDSE